MRVGLLGYGSMGRILLRSLLSGELGPYEVVLVAGSHSGSVEASGVRFTQNDADLLEANLDLVIEVASQEALRQWAEPVLRSGASLLLMSVGALSDREFLSRLERAAEEGGSYVHIPSGAVGALDVLKAASLGSLTQVRLITTKPPAALAGAPGTDGLDLDGLTSGTSIFQGSATEAATLFPKNLNVGTAVALAGIGLERTEVEVVAEPTGQRNSHRVVAEGDFGRLEFAVQNHPSPENPRSSHLAVLSAKALLRDLHKRVRIGT